jgi:hypothetical protein
VSGMQHINIRNEIGLQENIQIYNELNGIIKTFLETHETRIAELV